MNRGFSGDAIILEATRFQFAGLAAASMGQVNQQISSNNTADRILQARAAGQQPPVPMPSAEVVKGT